MIKNSLVVFLLLGACIVFAQEYDPIILDSIEISGERVRQPGTEITSEDMEKTGVQDLQQALSRVPGVTLTDEGARGESSFNIRGFDSKYIPIIVDGRSITSPFNGRGDSGSLLMGDMERIIVQKGYSSMLLGANGMGGAILLTTAKPRDSFEFYLKDTMEFDDRFSRSANTVVASAGTRHDLFYLKATFQYRDVDHTRLPGDYTPLEGSVQEKGKRLFSDREDYKTTLIAGITPGSDLDVWATYINQKSDRGMNPPQVSSLYSLSGWDYWKHESFSLNGEYTKNNWDVGFLAFYDTYNNSLSSYTSSTHIDFGRPYRITEYDEYAFGGRLNAGYTITRQHTLRGAFSFRQDDHWSYRNDLVDKDDIHVKENKISLGVEYEYKPLDKLRFIGSIGFDSLLPDTYWSRSNALAEYMGLENYQVDEDDRWLLAAQAGVFYEFIENHEVHLTYARRNQFPTMNDRYATRLGDSMPNPNLKPEIADHVELGYNVSFFYKVAVEAAVYYSHVEDKMAVIRVPDPFNSAYAVDFTTNLDAVSFYGFELATTLFLSQYLEMGGSLSWSDYSIDKSQGNSKALTYFPKFTASAYLDFTPWENYISIMPVMEYRSKRWADTSEINSLDAYYLYHLYVAFTINDYFKIDMAVLNIGDKLYEIRQYYPQAGRTYSLSVSLKY